MKSYNVNTNNIFLFVYFTLTEIRPVDRPDVLSKFFRDSNCVDKHNQARQSELALEKKWVTNDPYFRLGTTVVGVTTVDTLNLMTHHNLFPRHITNKYYTNDEKMSTITFAGTLCGQLLKMADEIESKRENNKRQRAIFEIESSDEYSDEDEIDETITYNNGKNVIISRCTFIESKEDRDGNCHSLCKFPVVQTGIKKKKGNCSTMYGMR